MLETPREVERCVDRIVRQQLPLGLQLRAHYDVPEALTARQWFRSLPHGAGYAHRLAPVLATGALVGVVESVCAEALQPWLGPEDTVVGRQVDIQHAGPAPVGVRLEIGGHLAEVRGRAARFEVEVTHGGRAVCRSGVVLVVVAAARFESAGSAG